MNIKIELLKLGKKQTDLVKEIRKRGFPSVQATHLSRYINDADTTPQAKAVLSLCSIIIDEWKGVNKK